MQVLFAHLSHVLPMHRHPLPAGEEVLEIGREKGLEPGPNWSDDYLSRRHLRIWREGGRWLLARLPADGGKEKAAVYVDAERTRMVTEPHALVPGQWLYVGRRGMTALALAESGKEPKPPTAANRFGGASGRAPLESPWHSRRVETDYSSLTLDYASRQRLKVLQEDLPRAIERWMTRTADGQGMDTAGGLAPRAEEEILCDEIAGVLRLALEGADLGGPLSVAFLAIDPALLAGTMELPLEELQRLSGEVRGWRALNQEVSRQASFRPSRQILQSLLDMPPGELGYWGRRSTVGEERAGPERSRALQQDWVLAMPLKGSTAAAGERVASLRLRGRVIVLYLSCTGSDKEPPADLHPFIRTVALQMSSLLETREQQRRQLQLARYFSPRLRKLVAESPESLAPVVFNCTVLFCDRRASSLSAETASGEAGLLQKLQENNLILGQVAEQVFQNEGAIADFAGDGVLGFWGWPPAEGSREHALQALHTAGQIAAALQQWVEPYTQLSRDMEEIVKDYGAECDFDLRFPAFRIGISTGSMAVGNVGLEQQMKIGVFGGPVNFGARLEGLGKMFRVPVIVSDETRQAVGDQMLMRRLCYIKPLGFGRVYPIHELVLPRQHGGSGATPDQVRRYEEALQHFVDRKFGLCIQQLAQLVIEGDTGAVWLLRTAQMLQQQRPGEAWQGEIVATEK